MKYKLRLTVALLALSMTLGAAERRLVRISTKATDWVLRVTDKGQLQHCYLGEKLQHEADLQLLSSRGKPIREQEAGTISSLHSLSLTMTETRLRS